MIRAVRQPLPAGSPFASLKIDIGLEIPSLSTVATFLAVSGPVLGVVLVKIIVFGSISACATEMGQVTAGAHQIAMSLALFLGVFGCACL